MARDLIGGTGSSAVGFRVKFLGRGRGILLSALFLYPGLVSGGEVVVGGALGVALPSGSFGNFAGAGLGFAACGVYYPGEGPWAFRVSGTGTWYGTTSVGALGQASLVDTSPTTFVLAGGPQLAKRTGKVRPYVNVLAGFAHFSTKARIAPPSPPLVATEFQDDVFAWSVSGGLLLPLSRGLNLDASFRYTGTGETQVVGASGFALGTNGAVAPILERDRLHAPEAILGFTFIL